MSDGERPGRFLWLLPGMRPPVSLPRQQEVVFLLIGTTLLFSGYDLNVFGLALPQIQRELHIPENMAGLTASYFRLAALAALVLAPLADIFGRRRLLLITVFGEAFFTLASAFAQDYHQFVATQFFARVFGYSEELLCFVVIAEEIDARVRGWATGTLAAINATGVGVASLMFALVNVLPFGWRALYILGGAGLLILAYYRRWLKETSRFELHRAQIDALGSKSRAAFKTLRQLVTEYPGRLAALMATVAAFGFAIGPATVLMAKYLQQDHHYSPGNVTVLYILGGFVAVAGNVLAGRISDSFGRKRVLFACAATSGIFFAIFFSGIEGWILPVSWILALFGYLAADALAAGYAAEIFPTAYRATTGTLRYVVTILFGGLALGLEGVFYDWFGGHGPAIAVCLAAIPIALIAILFLPETARRTLEDISHAEIP